MIHTTSVGDGPRRALVLHGILGSGRNWRSFGRRIVQRWPDWTLVMPDLRNHGDTGPLPGPNTVLASARDLYDLGAFELVMGHSYGGKVTLAYERPVARKWVLDSRPGASTEPQTPQNNDVLGVLAAIRSVRVPAASRKDVTEALAAAGQPPSITQWLATSLKKTDAGWVWKLDPGGAEQMLRDYFARDLWPAARDVTFVRATRSPLWTPEVRQRFDAEDVVVHELDADHWLHVSNPDGLLDLLSGAFG